MKSFLFFLLSIGPAVSFGASLDLKCSLSPQPDVSIKIDIRSASETTADVKFNVKASGQKQSTASEEPFIVSEDAGKIHVSGTVIDPDGNVQELSLLTNKEKKTLAVENDPSGLELTCEGSLE